MLTFDNLDAAGSNFHAIQKELDSQMQNHVNLRQISAASPFSANAVPEKRIVDLPTRLPP